MASEFHEGIIIGGKSYPVRMECTATPVKAIASEDSDVTFSVSGSVFGDGITYQWQYSTTGRTYASSTISGNKTNTLTVGATSGRNGYHYRCKITIGDNVIYTNPCILEIYSPNSGISATSIEDGDL